MKSGGAAPTFGLVLDAFEHGYQGQILSGAVAAAHERGASLLSVALGDLKSTSEPGAPGLFHDVLPSSHLDGLALLSGSLIRHLGTYELRAITDRYAAIPTVGIGADLPALPSIVADNRAGVIEAVSHLWSEGKRRIAFIAGPDNTPDTDERSEAYRQALSDLGAPFVPELFEKGDFSRDSGDAAIERLYATNGAGRGAIRGGFDAVVVANDEMAFGALRALQRLGCEVPGDVAVIGFDDLEECAFTSPSLTTIRQPLFEQGRTAILLLDEWARTKIRPRQRTALSTQLVTRASCVCAAPARLAQPEQELNKRFDAQQKARLLNRVTRELIGPAGIPHLADVLSARLSSLGVRACYGFLYEPQRPDLARVIVKHGGGRPLSTTNGRLPLERIVPEVLATSAGDSTWILSPLMAGAKQCGGLFLDVGDARQWEVFDELGRQVSLAVHAALLVERQAGHERRTSTLLEFRRAQSERSLEVPEILATCLRAMVDGARADFGFGVGAANTKELVCTSFPSVDQRVAAAVFERLQTLTDLDMPDTSAGGEGELFRSLGFGSVYIAPIRTHGVTFGTYCLVAKEPYAFNADAHELFKTILAGTISAFEKTQLRRTLSRIAQTPTLGFASDLKAITDHVTQELKFSGVAIWAVDEYTNLPEPVAERGLTAGIRRIAQGMRRRSNDLSKLIIERVIQGRAPIALQIEDHELRVLGEDRTIPMRDAEPTGGVLAPAIVNHRGSKLVVGVIGAFGLEPLRAAGVEEMCTKLGQLGIEYGEAVARARPQSWLAAIADEAIRLVGADSASVHVSRGGRMVLQAAAGQADAAFLKEFPPRSPGIGSRARADRSPIAVDDPFLQREHPKIFAKGVRAIAAFPLYPRQVRAVETSGKPALEATLYVHFWKPHVFSDSEKDLLHNVFAKEIELALGNYLESRSLHQAFQSLHSIDLAIGAVTQGANLQDVLAMILRKSLELTGATHGHICWYNPVLRHLELLADETRTYTRPEARRWDIKTGIVGRAATMRQSQLAFDVKEWDGIYEPVVKGTVSELAVPVQESPGVPEDERLWGVINLESPEPALFDGEHKALVEHMADLCVVVVQGAALHRQTSFLEALRTVALRAQLPVGNPEVVLNLIAKELVGSAPLGISHAAVLSLSPEDGVLAGWQATTCLDAGGDAVSTAVSKIELPRLEWPVALVDCLTKGTIIASAGSASTFGPQDAGRFARLFGAGPDGARSPLAEAFACVPLRSERQSQLGILVLSGPFLEQPIKRAALVVSANLVGGVVAATIEIASLRASMEMTTERKLKAVAGSAAHRILNQITNYDGIDAFLELEAMEQHPNIKKLDELAARIRDTTGTIKRMVDDFTKYCKPLALRRAETDVNKIIQDEAWHARPPAGIQILPSLDPNLPRLLIDGERFAEAIKELFRNAKKAISQAPAPGGNNIFVATSSDSEFVHIRVSDDGPGFAADFDAFVEFNSTDPASTGLGLVTVRDLVEAHGGSIKLGPRGGRGAEFSIRLPRLQG